MGGTKRGEGRRELRPRTCEERGESKRKVSQRSFDFLIVLTLLSATNTRRTCSHATRIARDTARRTRTSHVRPLPSTLPV